MHTAGFIGQPVMLRNGAVVDSQRLPEGAVLEAPVHVNEAAMMASISTAPGSARPQQVSGDKRRYSSSSTSRGSYRAQRARPSAHASESSPSDRRVSGAHTAPSHASESSFHGRASSVTDSLGSIVEARTVEASSLTHSQDHGSAAPYSSESSPHSIHYHPIEVEDSSAMDTAAMTGLQLPAIPFHVHSELFFTHESSKLLFIQWAGLIPIMGIIKEVVDPNKSQRVMPI